MNAGLCTLAGISQQHLLSNRREMGSIERKYMPNGESSATNEGMAGEIVELPLIGTKGPVKPDGVIKRGRKQNLVQDIVRFTPDGMSANHGISRQIIGQVGQAARM